MLTAPHSTLLDGAYVSPGLLQAHPWFHHALTNHCTYSPGLLQAHPWFQEKLPAGALDLNSAYLPVVNYQVRAPLGDEYEA